MTEEVSWMRAEIDRRHDHRDLDGLWRLALGLYELAFTPLGDADTADEAETARHLRTLIAQLDRARAALEAANQVGRDEPRKVAHRALTGLLASDELAAACEHLDQEATTT